MRTGSIEAQGLIKPRVVPYSDTATITINSDTADVIDIPSLSQATTFANPTGTPADMQTLLLRVVTSVSRSITWGSDFSSSANLSLPSATTGGGATDFFAFRRYSLTSKWQLVASSVNTVSFVISPGYISTLQSISNAGSLLLPHTLSTRPQKVQAELECLTSDLNYSVGDRIPISMPCMVSIGGSSYGVACTPDSTNLNIRFGANGIAVMDKTTGVISVITNNNWNVRFYAWKW